jgi:hypothetical protein
MGRNVPLVFVSGDGQRWSSVTGQPGLDPVPGYEQAHLDQVACREAGCVAAGTEWGTAGQRPFALVSNDGRAWERTPGVLTGSGPRALVATGRGFLLAGAANAPAGQLTHAAFWVSGDGRTWETAPDIPAFANAEPQALAVGQEIVVAVGCRLAATGLAPAAWTSVDGRSWMAAAETPAMAAWPAGRPTPVPVAMSGTAMWAVARVPGGFVAVGSRFGVNPAGTLQGGGEQRLTTQGVAWRSSDGVAWDMLPDDPLLPLGTSAGTLSGGLTGVVAREDQVIAVGASGADGVQLYFGLASARP